MSAWRETASVVAIVAFFVVLIVTVRCGIEEREQLEREGCEVVSTRRVPTGKLTMIRETWRCPDGREFER
jgi:hypothetical protein